MRRFGRVVYLVTLVIFLSHFGCADEPKGTPVAQVGDQVLTLEKLSTRIPQPFLNKINVDEKRHMVEKWVEDELLYQEAKIQKIDQDPKVKARIEEAQKGLLIAELLERKYAKNADILEGEIHDYYEAHAETFQREKPEIRVRHILVADRTALNNAMERLRDGELFDQVARDMSIDASVGDGGDLGYFTEDLVDPTFWEACQTAKIATPTRTTTKLGYHVIEVLDRREAGSQRAMIDVRGDIRQRILAERRQADRAVLLDEIRQRVATTIHVDKLN